MATYEMAGKGDLAFIDDVIEKCRGDLIDAGLTLTVQMVRPAVDGNGDPKGHALKHHGWPALALIKITNLKDRVAGFGDVRLLIDGDRWEEMPDEEKTALIHHEITHIELAVDKDGKLKRDDAGRPMLKMRLHDFEVGGFTDIVKKHGMHAEEAKALVNAHQLFKQGELQWG